MQLTLALNRCFILFLLMQFAAYNIPYFACSNKIKKLEKHTSNKQQNDNPVSGKSYRFLM